MMQVFGWAINHWIAGIMLPVSPTRVEAIREYVHSIDRDLGPRGYGSGLEPHEERAWRRAKRKFDVSAVRVRVELAFKERP
jgi:hypothetical protein